MKVNSEQSLELYSMSHGWPKRPGWPSLGAVQKVWFANTLILDVWLQGQASRFDRLLNVEQDKSQSTTGTWLDHSGPSFSSVHFCVTSL